MRTNDCSAKRAYSVFHHSEFMNSANNGESESVRQAIRDVGRLHESWLVMHDNDSRALLGDQIAAMLRRKSGTYAKVLLTGLMEHGCVAVV